MGLIQELSAILADITEAGASISKMSDALKKAYGGKEARSIMARLKGDRIDSSARAKAISAVNVWVHDLPSKKRILGFYKLDAPVAKHVPTAAPAQGGDSAGKKDDKKDDKK